MRWRLVANRQWEAVNAAGVPATVYWSDYYNAYKTTEHGDRSIFYTREEAMEFVENKLKTSLDVMGEICTTN